MTGRSWHRACPVGRAGLRLLRINYWDFQGYRRRGELAARSDAVRQMGNALAEMYRRELPIRSMYRVDPFGWSARLRGADDDKSMAAEHTSGVNLPRRGGQPGGSLAALIRPLPRPEPLGEPLPQLMARPGLRWTYGTSDAHHFDAGGSSPRMLARWADCDGVVCH